MNDKIPLKPGEDPNDFNAGHPEPVMEPARAKRMPKAPPAAEAVKVAEETFLPSAEPEKKEPTPEVKQQPLPAAIPIVNPLADENGVLLGADFQEQWKIASMMASSEMVPDHFRGKPAAVLMAIQTAKSRGLNPLTAIQQMANIFGRTSTYGELPLAEAFASKKLEDFQEFFIDKEGADIDERDIKTPVFGAVCIAKAFGRRAVLRIFTLEDAKLANLLDQPKRPTWQQYRKRMLQMRARGWALKDAVPEVTAGMQMPGYDEHEAPALTAPEVTGLAGRMNQKMIESEDEPALQN